MLTVIADDITGAAEIAGIGFRFGLRTALLTAVREPLPDCDILVVATDTRSMTEEEAVAETRRVVRRLQEAGVRELFKKTDSALRGHVVAELYALLEETSYTRGVYLPENPSKGRTVQDGVYYVNGIPLHETSFAFDPEFPATSSVVTERLPGMRRLEDTSSEGAFVPDREPVAESEAFPLFMADAATEGDVDSLLSSLDMRGILLAGAADLFTAYLKLRRGLRGSGALQPAKGAARESASRPREKAEQLVGRMEAADAKRFAGLPSGKALVVCGSTLSTSLAEQPYVRRHAIPVERMPEGVFEGTAPVARWSEQLCARYRERRSAILTIGYPSKGGKDFALRLRESMAGVVEALVKEACPEELIIEGGATAFSILRKLGWESFQLTDEVVPGVVRMRCTGGESDAHVTLKPGSYAWGELFR